MNITFDPTLESEFASYAYDDGGLKATKEHLIKDGLLVRGLGGHQSHKRTVMYGVANFWSSNLNSAPIDPMANLNLQHVNHLFNELIAELSLRFYV